MIVLLCITNILQTSMIRKLEERIDELYSDARNAIIGTLEVRSEMYVKLGELERQVNNLERHNK